MAAGSSELNCGSCGHTNRSGRKFCSECGSALSPRCGECGAENQPGEKFCGECGVALSTTAAPASVTLPAASPSIGTAAPQLTASFASDRYTALSFLGEGARKRVYLARDERLNREVAIAAIKTDGLDSDGLERVRREAAALGRLGDHPHIVTVHDVVDEAGQIHLVSEYLAGGDLEQRIRTVEAGRLELSDALRIGVELSLALEHAHGCGVIHRDIKPGNIWFTGDGTVRLGDFGLAVSLDQSRLSQEGMMIGTVAYMPPEQALGRPPDARSDLYALGTVLYEALCGRPPFVGDDAVAIISQHINTQPVSPSWHNSEIPRAVEDLILRLLAKSPEERPASAKEVQESLARLAAAPTQTATESVVENNPLDRLAGGVFVGRDAEMHQLRSHLDDAVAARGQVVMLVGEPGIGKTRTSEELATYAQMRGAQLLWGRCYEGEGAPIYWPWVQIIRSYVHEREPADLMSQMGPGAADIAEVVSEVRERLPGLPTPPQLEAEQARFRLFDSITTFLRNASQQRPLMIVLDDLHWADGSSLKLLQFLAREIQTSRILLVGTYRDVELGRQHPLEQTLAELTREQLFQRVLLRGLDREGVERFIEQTAHIDPPAALVDTVFRETEGNPFFISEVVRLLESDGRLQQLDSVASWSVDVPQGVRQVVGRRLSTLSEECNRVLSVAAVIGREFAPSLLARATDKSEDALVEPLEEALASRLVEEDGVARYRFSHALVQQTLFDELSTPRRVSLHRRIGAILEELHADHLDPHLATIAHHFFQSAQAGDVERSIDYSTRAGDHAAERLAYAEAATHYERAIQAIELQSSFDARQRCELLIAQGRFEHLSASATARAASRRAVDCARDLGDAELLARAVLEHRGSFVLVQMGRVDDEMIALYEETLRELGGEDSISKARVLSTMAVELMFSMDPDRIAAVGSEAVAIARRLDEPALLAEVLNNAIFGHPIHDFEGISRIVSEVIELAENQGDDFLLFNILVHRFIESLVLGRRSDAYETFRRVSQLGAELRTPLGQYYPKLHSAMLALLEGRLDDAEALSAEAFAIGQRAIGGNAIQWFASLRGLVNYHRGETMAGTLPVVEKMVEEFPEYPVYRIAMCQVCIQLGDLDRARELFEEVAADDFASLPRDGNFGVSMLWLTQACLAFGDTDRARLLYDLHIPMQHLNILLGAAAVYYGNYAARLGTLCTILERYDEAEEHYRNAIERDERIGAVLFIAESQLGYAQMLIGRGRPEDIDRARGLLNAALETARRTGAKRIMNEALQLKLQIQGVSSGTLDRSIEAIAHSVDVSRPDFSGHASPDGTVTLMFSDMEGFTEMTERLGDLAAHEVVQQHNQVVREATHTYGGHEVELRGDGFLLAFSSARKAALCAIHLQRTFAAYCEDHPEQPIRIHIGLHTGEAIRDADKFFGKSVIQAFRIADQARGGEILVSSLLKELAEPGGDLQFDQGRELELKGLSGIHRVYALQWA